MKKILSHHVAEAKYSENELKVSSPCTINFETFDNDNKFLLIIISDVQWK